MFTLLMLVIYSALRRRILFALYLSFSQFRFASFFANEKCSRQCDALLSPLVFHFRTFNANTLPEKVCALWAIHVTLLIEQSTYGRIRNLIHHKLSA